MRPSLLQCRIISIPHLADRKPVASICIGCLSVRNVKLMRLRSIDD